MGCRVRISNDTAIIELLEKDIKHFVQEETRQLIMKKLNDFNMKNVFLDMKGRKGIQL
jgi:PP-loop superfamily ATP-utilizing enzyme